MPYPRYGGPQGGGYDGYGGGPGSHGVGPGPWQQGGGPGHQMLGPGAVDPMALVGNLVGAIMSASNGGAGALAMALQGQQGGMMQGGGMMGQQGGMMPGGPSGGGDRRSQAAWALERKDRIAGRLQQQVGSWATGALRFWLACVLVSWMDGALFKRASCPDGLLTPSSGAAPRRGPGAAVAGRGVAEGAATGAAGAAARPAGGNSPAGPCASCLLGTTQGCCEA
jgi:hypothetical protein